MKSIRVFLVVLLVAIITLANFAAAVRGYLGSMDEAERLFNQRLLQQVDLLNYVLPARYEEYLQRSSVEIFPFQNNAERLNLSPAIAELQFQWVSNDGALLARSAAMPDELIGELKTGYQFVNFNHYRWHVLVAPAANNTGWYLLAERDDQRYRLAESMILQAVFPMIITIPIVGLVIWWVLGIGLRPVSSLAKEFHAREATDLRPIEQQDMPSELIQLAQSANELLRRLESSFLREQRFSADAAHELRTPIAALMIHCDNLLHDIDPAPESAYKLQQGIKRMRYLVEQILLLNKTSPDHFMSQFKSVDLTALVKHVIVSSSDALSEKNLTIEFDGDRCWVEGDAAALETLINNLLGNAIKYTPEDGKIILHTWLRGKEVVFEIIDNGPGIPADQYERVFDRFYRLHGDRHDSRTPGCGLGLSIVKQVVDLHRARIHLTRSPFESGLSVIVTFAACEKGETAQ
ncbi:MAG: HAMP domain-containing sensor histidine kinase [Cellvibrio sp.]|uniref:sensor histidine kinase n=1 Tax=Cellvibrio sp. TaxID=1965322 RepID=UPI0031B0386C